MNNCAKIKKMLNAYADFEVTKKEEDAIKNHLIICKDCQNTYNELLETKKTICNNATVKIPDNFNEILHQNLINNNSSEAPIFRKNHRRSIIVTICLVLILSAITVGEDYNYIKNVSQEKTRTIANAPESFKYVFDFSEDKITGNMLIKKYDGIKEDAGYRLNLNKSDLSSLINRYNNLKIDKISGSEDLVYIVIEK